jgi:hypothetical protein
MREHECLEEQAAGENQPTSISRLCLCSDSSLRAILDSSLTRRFENCGQQQGTNLVVGEKVRIKRGSMQGVEGTLIRKKASLRFVLSLELINQHAAVEVAADELEPVPN